MIEIMIKINVSICSISHISLRKSTSLYKPFLKFLIQLMNIEN